MRALIAIVVVLLLMAMTALAVLWLLPPRTAALPQSSGPEPEKWQKVAGAVTIGVGAYMGRDEGTRAASDLARGAGWL